MVTVPAELRWLRQCMRGGARAALHEAIWSVEPINVGRAVMATNPGKQQPEAVRHEFLGHFFPLSLTFLLLMIELSCGVVANRIEAAGGMYGKGLDESGSTPVTVKLFEIEAYPAEIIFALLAFWVWAVTTSGTMNQLVRGGGRKSGTVEERRREFVPVLVFSLATIFLFSIAFVRIVPMPWTWFPAVVATAFPFVILGKPKKPKKPKKQ